jgi:hypothetical protein
MADHDLYTLAGERGIDSALRFIEAFTGTLGETRQEYEFPQFAKEPEAVYFATREIAAQLMVRREEEYALYWRRPPGLDAGETVSLVTAAMLFFNKDASMVAGISVASDDPHVLAVHLERLARSVGARYGYCVHDQPPAGNASLFRTFAAQGATPRFFKGELIK